MMIRIAAHNSSARDKSAADYVCTGTSDEAVIASALAALGHAPGTLIFHDGEYGPGGLTNQAGTADPAGCLFIRRGDITLKSDGIASFRLADAQNCNIWRSVGDGLKNIRFGEGFVLDGNLANNPINQNFETCGVRLNSTGATPYENVWVTGVRAFDCRALNVMAGGMGVHVRDSVFGDAGSDVVEIANAFTPCSGGDITNCEATIKGNTGFVFGSDGMGDIAIVNNRTHIKAGGRVHTAVHRTWQSQYVNLISGNRITYEVGAVIDMAIHARGYHNLIAGNVIIGRGGDYGRPRVVVNGLTGIHGNYMTYADVSVEDTSGAYKVSYSGHGLGCRFPGAAELQQGSILYPAIPSYAGFIYGSVNDQ